MSNVTTYQRQDLFETELAGPITNSATTVVVVTAPSFVLSSGSFFATIDPTGTPEIIEITAMTTVTWTVTRGIALYEGAGSSAAAHAGGVKVLISNNWKTFDKIREAIATKFDTAGGTFTGSVAFSGASTTFKVPTLTTAERDALSAANGMVIYNTTAGEFQLYQGGSWSTASSGSTQPNASTTVAGKVEEATQSENDAGTTAGASADLFATPAVNAATAQKSAWLYAADAGSRDNYSVTLTPALGAYAAGVHLFVKCNTASANEVTIEDCEDAWNESAAAGVTATADADCQVGSFSSKLAVDASVAAGTILATEALSSANLSAHGSVGLWLKSSVTTAAGDLQLLLDNTASCVSPLESIDLPALTANTWTYTVVALAAPASDTAIISVGIKMVVDLGAFNLFVDDIQAVPSLNVNSLGLKALRKNSNSRVQVGDIESGQIVEFMYDGTYMQMLSPSNPLTTKGDLLVGTGGGSTARRAVGADNTILYADSTQPDGVKWAARPGFATGQTTRAAAAGTGTTTIAHGLGVTPRFVRITAVAVATADDQALMMSWGTATSTSTETCVYGAAPTASLGSNVAGSDSDSIIYLNNGDGSKMFEAQLSTLDSTNIVLDFTTNAAAGGTCNIQWEAFE